MNMFYKQSTFSLLSWTVALLFFFMPLASFAVEDTLSLMTSPVTNQIYTYQQHVEVNVSSTLPPDYQSIVKIFIDDFNNEVGTVIVNSYGEASTTTQPVFFDAGSAEFGTHLYQLGGEHTILLKAYTESECSILNLCAQKQNVQVYEFRTYTVEPVPTPQLVIFSVPGAGTFDNVLSDATQPGQIVIRNTGGASAEGTAFNVIEDGFGHFYVVGGDDYSTVSIQSLTNHTIDILYNPGGYVGSDTATIQFTCVNDVSCVGDFIYLSGSSKVLAPSEIQLTFPATSNSYPATMNFGDVTLDAGLQSQTIQINNSGELELAGEITFTPNTGQYSCVIDAVPGDCSYDSILPGASKIVEITFDPSVSGVDNASMDFSAVGGTGASRSVAGNGIGEVLIDVQSSYDFGAPSPPTDWIIPSPFHIGSTATPTASFRVRNIGAYTLDGAVTGLPDDGFTCISGCTYSGLTATSSFHTVTLQFAPNSAGVKNAIAHFSNNSNGSDFIDVDLGTAAAVNDNPIVHVSPNVWDAGNMNMGLYATTTFQVTNIGALTLSGSVTPPGGGFYCYSGCTYSGLGEGDIHTVTMVFSSVLAGGGAHAATAVFSNNEDVGDEFLVNLDASVNAGGVLDVVFYRVDGDFENVLIGDTRDLHIITLQNTGVQAITAEIVGGNTDFECATFSDCNFVVNVGASKDINIRFNSSGADTVKTNIFTASTTAGNRSFGVRGTTIDANFSIQPSAPIIHPIDFGTVNDGDTKILDFGAGEFDGSNDYARINNVSLPSGTGDFTYAGWIAPDTLNDEVILMAANSSGSNEFIVRVSNAHIEVGMNNSWTVLSSVASVPADEWTHFAVTRVGGQVVLYMNGVFDRGAVHVAENDALSFSGCPLFIGTDIDSGCSNSPSQFFNGSISDIRVYAAGLSSVEVAALANESVALEDNPPSLVGHWTFDASTISGNIVSDMTGNGADALLVNGATDVLRGTFMVKNTGLQNQGDLGGNDILVTLDLANSPHITCVSGCNPTLAEASDWHPVVLEFTPDIAATGDVIGEYVLFDYVSTKNGALSDTSGNRYVRGYENSESIMHVESDYASSSPPGDWDVTPGSPGLDYWNMGATTSVTYYVTNIGTAALNGTVAVAPSTDFDCVIGCVLPGIINDGSVHEVVIELDPSSGGTKNAILTFTDSGTSDMITANLHAQVNDLPLIAVIDVAGAGFGTVAISAFGQGLEKDFIITNTGFGDLIGAVSVDAPFYCVDVCTYTIAAGEATTTTIEFRPNADGFVSKSATFSGGTGASITVTGIGHLLRDLSIDPFGFVSFGEILSGETVDREFELSNNGLGSLIGLISTEDPFSCLLGCSYTIGSGASTTRDIRFAPVITQTYSSDLTFSGRTTAQLYYSFDRMDIATSSGHVYDMSGNGNTGTAINNPVFTGTGVGVYGTEGMRFDGGDYISVPDSPELSPRKAVTAAFWIKSAGAATWDGWDTAVNKPSSYYVQTVQGTKQIRFRVYRGASDYSTHTYTSFKDLSGWTHYVMTYENGDIKIYEDGVLRTQLDGNETADIVDNTQTVRIGQNLRGEMDEVQVYDRVLSDAEVMDLFLEGDKVRVDIAGERKFGAVINFDSFENDFGKVKLGETKVNVFEFRNNGTGRLGPGIISLTDGTHFSCLKTMYDPTVVGCGGLNPPCCLDPIYQNCAATGSCIEDVTCGYDADPDDGYFCTVIQFAPISVGVLNDDLELSSIVGFPLGVLGEGYVPGFIYQEY